MKRRKINKPLSLTKHTVADLNIEEKDAVKGGAPETGLPIWTCYYPTYCYPSPATACSPTECNVPCR